MARVALLIIAGSVALFLAGITVGENHVRLGPCAVLVH